MDRKKYSTLYPKPHEHLVFQGIQLESITQKIILNGK